MKREVEARVIIGEIIHLIDPLIRRKDQPQSKRQSEIGKYCSKWILIWIRSK